MDERRVDQKPYETPKLQALGDIRELTREIVKCSGSADAVLPRNPPPGDDFDCVVDSSTGPN
jgi:hypothetical protein